MKTRSLIILAAASCGLASFSRAQSIDSFAPVVVKTMPEAGSKNVSPGEYEIKVTFSKEMTDGSWSWSTAWENSTPEMIGKPHYEADHKTCAVKVRLEPGKTYGWWLNSEKFHGFQDKKNHPAAPYLLTFKVGTAASPVALHLNPATGLQEAGPSSGIINPVTGIPMGSPNAPTANGPAAFKIDPGELHAAAETWSPTVDLGEKPDLQKIRDEIKTLMEQRQYEEALQHQIWYFNHALEFGEPNPVRTSFGIMNWAELGRRYPKAKLALIEIRDAETREFAAGRGYSELFMEIQAINRELQDDDATYALYKSFREKDPQLGQQCYYYIESQLVAKGEYQWCYDHMGDPQSRFNLIRQGYDMSLSSQKRMAELQQRTRQMIEDTNRKNGWTNQPAYSPPDTSAMMKKNHEDRFIGQTRQLIEILIATSHPADAQKIQDQAVAVMDDDRVKSAVADAQAKLKK